MFGAWRVVAVLCMAVPTLAFHAPHNRLRRHHRPSTGLLGRRGGHIEHVPETEMATELPSDGVITIPILQCDNRAMLPGNR